ncbi:glycosyltransferase family 39 protein [Sulfurihydrogenibium sp.]|uniref:ArnT family glycosyltransferase n=1 Tax=Sulfurihydrogenibium sp. TaxID=2053621 RepID=UPI002626ACD9|nr:glycosyltransferase family 39 protein [Sulfurihydrogenibium sp.]
MENREENFKIYLFVFLTVFIYFWNFWYNAIWIPNESFYAEAVREMFESGNFLDIYYNYEPRFNKPPLTYWIVALSSFLFGLNEFAIRLPIVLMAIGSSFLTYKIGEILYGKTVGMYSFFVMAFSFQFVINSRYTSPEVPLLFLFTLTLYLFLKGYKENKFFYILLSYISLGLTVLTKGYPYFFVIGGIVGLYLLIESHLDLKEFFKKLFYLKVYVGIPISLFIGLSWVVYMDLKFGDEFWSVYNEETLKRAFKEESKFSDLFFYLVVILWGFLPYSLTFYYSFLSGFKKLLKDFSFIFSWIFVMFVVFTIAKGKIPTYFIQAHPALSVLVGYFLVNHNPDGLKKYFWIASFLVPAFVITVMNVYILYTFNLDYFYYFICLFPFLYIIRYKDYRLVPFLSMMITFMILTVSLLVKVENYRPYKEIGEIVNKNVPDRSVPLIVQNRFFHNLPFYAKRKVLRDYTENQILQYQQNHGYTLALVEEETLNKIGGKVLWSGYLYPSSESRFAVFLKNVAKAEKGDYSGFVKMYLVYTTR